MNAKRIKPSDNGTAAKAAKVVEALIGEKFSPDLDPERGMEFDRTLPPSRLDRSMDELDEPMDTEAERTEVEIANDILARLDDEGEAEAKLETIRALAQEIVDMHSELPADPAADGVDLDDPALGTDLDPERTA